MSFQNFWEGDIFFNVNLRLDKLLVPRQRVVVCHFNLYLSTSNWFEEGNTSTVLPLHNIKSIDLAIFPTFLVSHKQSNCCCHRNA